MPTSPGSWLSIAEYYAHITQADFLIDDPAFLCRFTSCHGLQAVPGFCSSHVLYLLPSCPAVSLSKTDFSHDYAIACRSRALFSIVFIHAFLLAVRIIRGANNFLQRFPDVRHDTQRQGKLGVDSVLGSPAASQHSWQQVQDIRGVLTVS